MTRSQLTVLETWSLFWLWQKQLKFFFQHGTVEWETLVQLWETKSWTKRCFWIEKEFELGCVGKKYLMKLFRSRNWNLIDCYICKLQMIVSILFWKGHIFNKCCLQGTVVITQPFVDQSQIFLQVFFEVDIPPQICNTCFKVFSYEFSKIFSKSDHEKIWI